MILLNSITNSNVWQVKLQNRNIYKDPTVWHYDLLCRCENRLNNMKDMAECKVEKNDLKFWIVLIVKNICVRWQGGLLLSRHE